MEGSNNDEDELIKNLDGNLDLDHPKSMKKINRFYTYGDMIYELYDNGRGSKPHDLNYKQKAMEWIKINVLSKTILEPNEIEWLNERLDYFYPYAKKIWKQHRGHITGEKVKKKHASFFNKFIDPTINIEHNRGKYKCGECFGNFTSFETLKTHLSHHHSIKVDSENASRDDVTEEEKTEEGKYL